MKGKVIIMFFIIFAVATYLIPAPLFPGNWFCMLIGSQVLENIQIFSALFNGAFYGTMLWLLFIALGRKIMNDS
jgi:hypothetical protein